MGMWYDWWWGVWWDLSRDQPTSGPLARIIWVVSIRNQAYWGCGGTGCAESFSARKAWGVGIDKLSLSLYIYIYICTYIHTCIHTCIHACISTDIHKRGRPVIFLSGVVLKGGSGELINHGEPDFPNHGVPFRPQMVGPKHLLDQYVHPPNADLNQQGMALKPPNELEIWGSTNTEICRGPNFSGCQSLTFRPSHFDFFLLVVSGEKQPMVGV